MSFNYLNLLTKGKRSQSALEYMMTYGWAILIIVIVAVILYSMGIFNPSSSITTTSIGFSPFTVSSTVCSQAGLSVAIIGGGLPDTATQATITKIYITSNTGTTALTKAYTLNPVIISPGKTATIVIPTVACTSANVKYSLSAKLQYSYSTPAAHVVTNTTGTIAGTSSSNPIVKYVPLTITSSAATPSPFQQMVIVNMNNYNSYASSNLSNIEFTYPNGTIIPSWRENGTSNSQVVTYWLKLGSFTTTTVYLDFFSTSSNVLNTVNTGEAPQLSSNYAQYDDGVHVFYLYFNGNTPTSDFTTGPGSSLSSVSRVNYNGISINALNLTAQASVSAMTDSAVGIPAGAYIAESNIESSNPSVGYVSWSGLVNDATANDLTDGIGSGQCAPPLCAIYWNADAGNVVMGSYSLSAFVWYISQTVYPGTSSSSYLSQVYSNSYRLLSSVSASTNPLSSVSTFYFGLPTGNGGVTGAILYFNWGYVRAYPPNGVMPSVSFGSVA